jgi:hypothetical protein
MAHQELEPPKEAFKGEWRLSNQPAVQLVNIPEILQVDSGQHCHDREYVQVVFGEFAQGPPFWGLPWRPLSVIASSFGHAVMFVPMVQEESACALLSVPRRYRFR